MMNLPDAKIYDDIQRQQTGDIALTRIRNLWFDNYEKNLPLVKEWGGLDRMPVLERAIVVGAGWTLDRNIAELEGIGVPVIVCDKSAHRVAPYVRPLAVTAINTQRTEVVRWIGEFNNAMEERWGPEATKDVYLVVPVTVNPEVFNPWKGKIAFINPANTCNELVQLVYQDTGLMPTIRGDNSGFFSLIIAVSLGAREVALMGMPYSYRTEEEVLELTAGWHVVKLKDVNQDYVYTTIDWLDARREFVHFCREAANELNVTVTNCSEGGMLYQPGVIRPCKMSIWKAHLMGGGRP